MTRYFEDFAAGQTFDLGTVVAEEAEMVAFARRFDPQPFHVDPSAAADGPFGGLIASGWYTVGLWMRLYVDAVLADAASLGSPGGEELRWLQPVRPGDRLRGELRILQVRPSAKDPGRGSALICGELHRDEPAGEVLVMRLRARGLFGRRPEAVLDPT